MIRINTAVQLCFALACLLSICLITHCEANDNPEHNLCDRSNYYNTLGENIYNWWTHDSCKRFINRHPEMESDIYRVITLDWEDARNIGPLLEGHTVKNRSIFCNHPLPRNAITLLTFGEGVCGCIQNDYTSIDCLNFAPDGKAQQLRFWMLEKPVSITIDTPGSFIMDGISMHSKYDSNLRIKSHNVKLVNFTLQKPIEGEVRVASSSILVTVVSGGLLSIKESSICCTLDHSNICLAVDHSGGRGISVDIDRLKLNLKFSNEGSGQSLCSTESSDCSPEGLHLSGLEKVRIHDLSISTEESINPIRLVYAEESSFITGCVSDFGVDTDVIDAPIHIFFHNKDAQGCFELHKAAVRLPSVDRDADPYIPPTLNQLIATQHQPDGFELRQEHQRCYELDITCNHDETSESPSSITLVITPSVSTTEEAQDVSSTTDIAGLPSEMSLLLSETSQTTASSTSQNQMISSQAVSPTTYISTFDPTQSSSSYSMSAPESSEPSTSRTSEENVVRTTFPYTSPPVTVIQKSSIASSYDEQGSTTTSEPFITHSKLPVCTPPSESGETGLNCDDSDEAAWRAVAIFTTGVAVVCVAVSGASCLLNAYLLYNLERKPPNK